MQSEAKTQLSAITAWYITDLSPIPAYIPSLSDAVRTCTYGFRENLYWSCTYADILDWTGLRQNTFGGLRGLD